MTARLKKAVSARPVSGSAALIALILLPFSPQPTAASWPYLFVSCALQVVYTVLVAKTYQVSDMSQTYPLMRGTAPLLVALISVLALGDHLSWLAWSGIGVICLSILAMAMNGRMQSRKGIWLALLNACFIAGYTLVDGTGVGDVGSVVLRDRRHLAQDGMIVVVVSLSGETGELVSGPDIITRGFVYVKESESLMEELREVALEALDACQSRGIGDWATIKSAMKGEMSRYLYKKTKRNPMILPVIMEV